MLNVINDALGFIVIMYLATLIVAAKQKLIDKNDVSPKEFWILVAIGTIFGLSLKYLVA